jgi:hypothetical protein
MTRRAEYFRPSHGRIGIWQANEFDRMMVRLLGSGKDSFLEQPSAPLKSRILFKSLLHLLLLKRGASFMTPRLAEKKWYCWYLYTELRQEVTAWEAKLTSQFLLVKPVVFIRQTWHFPILWYPF